MARLGSLVCLRSTYRGLRGFPSITVPQELLISLVSSVDSWLEHFELLKILIDFMLSLGQGLTILRLFGVRVFGQVANDKLGMSKE